MNYHGLSDQGPMKKTRVPHAPSVNQIDKPDTQKTDTSVVTTETYAAELPPAAATSGRLIQKTPLHPQILSSHHVLQLQSILGNRATTQLLEQHRAANTPISDPTAVPSPDTINEHTTRHIPTTQSKTVNLIQRGVGKVRRRQKGKKSRIKKPDKFALIGKHKEADVHITVPQSLARFVSVTPKQILNYYDWLFSDDNWVGRSKAVLKNRTKAKKKLELADQTYNNAFAKLKEKDDYRDLLAKWSRKEARDYDTAHQDEINEVIAAIHLLLAEIDELVHEPPPPPKTWASFMGDQTALGKYYDGSSPAKAIPVVWYKEESNYEAIHLKGKTYDFPEGPIVQGRLKKYTVKVDDRYRFKVGTVFKNEKMQEKRTTQVDINYALKKAGASLAGKDGDHVTDLGFGGVDSEKNYWPLKAEINRRPFLGWRSTYGINYIDSKGQPKTAALGTLTGKWLKIKAFMAPGDSNAPDEGVKPEEKSGTADL